MSSKILVALRIAAPPEAVFDAFTHDIALWWRPNTLFSFTPRSPGVMAFEDGRLVGLLSADNVSEALTSRDLVRDAQHRHRSQPAGGQYAPETPAPLQRRRPAT